jgi:hypothetical protein
MVGDGDALGKGDGWTVAVFELPGPAVQPANKHKAAMTIKNR